MSKSPNLLFILADQLRAASVPLYGESQIRTPHIDRLAAGGLVLDNMVSTCPLCTPYRSMLLTGRHPQTTGHVINFVTTRYDELSIADAFSHAGYRTGYVGKWHLHTGSWPPADMVRGEGPFYIPEGRDRLGFDYWRAYNFHWEYFDGWLNTDGWHTQRWQGYETDALAQYATEFLEETDDQKPFCLFVSPHQPHNTLKGMKFAPERYYDFVPEQPELPANVPESMRAKVAAEYRHYLAMTLAIDDMVGQLLDALERVGKADDTLVVFTSDHGSQFGAHGQAPWNKQQPYRESMDVPMVMRLPGVLEGGARRDVLTAPVDLFPSLCGLCGVPVPQTVEGLDLSDAWRGRAGAREQDAVPAMNFTQHLCFPGKRDDPGARSNEKVWRAVRTRQHTYVQRLDGAEELYDLREDPLEQTNRAVDPAFADVRARLASRLDELLAQRGDRLDSDVVYQDWFDHKRRVAANAFGPLPHPEDPPDWSKLAPAGAGTATS